ncbi:hypothetical protein [Neosynechococcus sphagnicola]|uniref:hypothetical protein n=1 Tax=Neosynechococcus sphagnicola TaxID=1501145 RepID=UPI0012E004F1|nr:hypothetical protein [Neosynechococcus sphagnicola]
MTETPGTYSSNPGNQRDDLKRQCHRLIEAIAGLPQLPEKADTWQGLDHRRKHH